MKKKPFVKNKLYLGGKKQKGGSFLLGFFTLLLIGKLLFGKGKRRKRGRKIRRW